MKKKLSDMVFQRVTPPDHKDSMEAEDLAHVLVKRLGLERKASKARHHKLLMEMIRYRKENVPLGIDQISDILNVSQSQTYEELRKWRTMGLIEFVKIPAGEGFVKGYMLTSNTVNRMLDKTESSVKSFMRRTRRIAKDFDDLLMLEIAREARDVESGSPPKDQDEHQEDDEDGANVDYEEDEKDKEGNKQEP